MNPLLGTEIDLKGILSKGVDERLYSNDFGKIKYGISLTDLNIFNRGSCTCNPLTQDNYELIQELISRNFDKEQWLDLLRSQVKLFKQLINTDKNNIFDVCFAPSGTHLSYFPLIFSKLLYPDKAILNIITCAEELGSGTRLTTQGKFHSDYNQFDEKVLKGTSAMNENIECHYFQARTKAGDIYKPLDEIREIVNAHPNHSIIINLVYGSKSGIEDNLSIINEIKNDNVIWNLDLCQFRHSKELINKLLRHRVIVMLTGSKFYQAPPFCAASLIPKEITHKIKESKNWNVVNNFDKIFSKYDFPEDLWPHISINQKLNTSSILRWECALNEIMKYNSIQKDTKEKMIDKWNRMMNDELGKFHAFEMMPDQNLTNKTIISFRLKSDGQFLNAEESQRIYNDIVNEDYSSQYSFSHLFFGQPVNYGDRSFVRMAIGSKTLREFIACDESEFAQDKELVKILASKLNESD